MKSVRQHCYCRANFFYSLLPLFRKAGKCIEMYHQPDITAMPKLLLRFIKFQGVQVASFLRRTKGYFGTFLYYVGTSLHVFEEHE